jgi:ATP-dependent RNA helicase DDX10/DBP4
VFPLLQDIVRGAEIASNDEDDGYVSPEFDLPSESGSEPDDDGDDRPNRSKKRKSLRSSDAGDHQEEEDLEALALQKLSQRLKPTL